MPFLLGTDNVIGYLSQQRLKGFEDGHPIQIQPKPCKNFNLIVEFGDRPSLLLKQEPHTLEGQTSGDLGNEWQVHRLLQTDSFQPLQGLISPALAFDSQHAILILRYLTDYDDLESVYNKGREYPPAIAQFLGSTLAAIHRSTFNREDAKRFLLGLNPTASLQPPVLGEDIPDFSKTLHRVTPDTFGQITTDGLKFYELMQRYESLGEAIAQLNTHYAPCCLIHGDLKFANLLLHQGWHETVADRFNPQCLGENAPLRVIDWEKWLWGDPAYDLGSLVAAYLKRWLKSLIASQDIPIDLTLKLAGTPLEQVQPSLVQLMHAYLNHFPEVLERFPDFWTRVMRFAGLVLIESIQAHLHYYEPFGNGGICTLQVAKTLLCAPEASIPTVFGRML